MTNELPPGSEPTGQVPATPGAETGSPAPPSGTGSTGSGRRLVASYPPADLRQRVRKLADPAGYNAPIDDGTLTDQEAQPLAVDDLAEPMRHRVAEALRGRSRALGQLSVRQSQAVAILVLVLGAAGSLGAAWVCVHAVTPSLSPHVNSQTFILFLLSTLAAAVTALLAYGLARTLHHQAIRRGHGMVGVGLGATVVAVFWIVVALVYQPWAFPGPARTRTVPMSTIEQALSQSHYLVVTYGELSGGTFSTEPSIFLEMPTHQWLAAPLPQPVPLLLGLTLVRARTVPISAVEQAIGAEQLAALRQHNLLIAILLAVEAVVAVALFFVQRGRWRDPPQVSLSERQLQQLIGRIRSNGPALLEWSLGEDHRL